MVMEVSVCVDRQSFGSSREADSVQAFRIPRQQGDGIQRYRGKRETQTGHQQATRLVALHDKFSGVFERSEGDTQRTKAHHTQG